MYRLSQQEVRNEIYHSAREWGLLRRSSSNQRDQRFCKEVTELAIESLVQPPSLLDDLNDAYDYLRTGGLSHLEQDAAVRLVLVSELKGAMETDRFIDAQDDLKMTFQPFFRHAGRGTYERCRDFEKFKPEQLDPFSRFSAVPMNAEEWYHIIWRNNTGSLDGIVFEAIVAQYMECHMACHSCKCRKSLRWNGGYGMLSSWSDVVCLNCHATYEIKSKANIDKVDKALKFNNIGGSSFKTFYKYHPGKKRYLVLVCRAASFHKKEGMTHRVSIGEITKITPRLTGESFAGNTDNIRIRSEIEMKRATVITAWCQIPEYRGDFISLAEEVYDEIFGEGKWDGKMAAPAQSIPEQPGCHSASAKEDQEEAKSEKDVVDSALSSIRASLEELKMEGRVDDDGDNSSDGWEGLYYGSDF